MGADAEVAERAHVGRERVQLDAEACLGLAERVADGPRLPLRLGQEAEPPEVAADVVLEVLDLVEVAGPVDVAVARAAPAEQ